MSLKHKIKFKKQTPISVSFPSLIVVSSSKMTTQSETLERPIEEKISNVEQTFLPPKPPIKMYEEDTEPNGEIITKCFSNNIHSINNYYKQIQREKNQICKWFFINHEAFQLGVNLKNCDLTIKPESSFNAKVLKDDKHKRNPIYNRDTFRTRKEITLQEMINLKKKIKSYNHDKYKISQLNFMQNESKDSQLHFKIEYHHVTILGKTEFIHDSINVKTFLIKANYLYNPTTTINLHYYIDGFKLPFGLEIQYLYHSNLIENHTGYELYRIATPNEFNHESIKDEIQTIIDKNIMTSKSEFKILYQIVKQNDLKKTIALLDLIKKKTSKVQIASDELIETLNKKYISGK